VSKPKNVKKSLIISPILHHSQTVEDCLRKRKIGNLKKKKMSTIVLILFFAPTNAINWQPLKKKILAIQ